MNENIDLTQILKDCPKGTKLYSSIHGEVEFIMVHDDNHDLYPIKIGINSTIQVLTKDGKLYDRYNDAECILFPSKNQRDWSKFKVDLPIDTPVMVSLNTIDWSLRYYAGNNRCWYSGYKSKDDDYISDWKYIIPFDKFNPSNIEGSLKYNITNN